MDDRTSDAPIRLGRYAAVRRIGAGGMAEVFLARSRGAEGTDKLLVVKRILPAFASNARFRSMFVDEAKVALRLNHPNIVQVYGFESDGPTLLLVMEYVDGGDLSLLARTVRHRREKLPHGLAAFIGREIARGLHYAHERRDEDGTALDIVHRDVSPGNVLVSRDGVVKLGDFGIAKARRVAADADDGSLKGKFAYMSPDQARGGSVDRRADVFSLGIVLGELLAGGPLYDAALTSDALLARLRRGEVPDIHALAPDAPMTLRALVAKMLAPDPADRYPTARDAARALTHYISTLDEEWDPAALEHYLGRLLPRPREVVQVPAVPPPSHGASIAGTSASAPPDQPTIAYRQSREIAEVLEMSRPSAGVHAGALMRERVHVGVIVGRVVAPESTVDTVDTRPLFDLVESLAFKADATLERSDDGRFTLVVGVVQPNVDHVLRASRLALDIHEDVRALAGDQGDGSLEVALGLARGVAAAARESDGTLLGYEVVDEAIASATALSDAAQPGETLVTPALWRVARRAFVLGEPTAVPGTALRALRLERMKSRAERESDVADVQQVLVGRERELAQLHSAFVETRNARAGRALVVSGESGIGKSALVAAFAAAGTDVGSVVRVPVGFGAHDRAFRGVAGVLLDVLGVSESDAEQRPVVDAAVERAAEIAGGLSGAGQRTARRALRVMFGLESDEGANERVTVREVVLVLRRLLAARALMNPVALVIDGIEQADRASREVIAELLRRPPSAPVLLVVTLRDNDPMARELSALPTLMLPLLADEARAQLIARRLGATDAARDLVRDVSAAAGGNPLMIIEVLETLVDRGRIDLKQDASGAHAVLGPLREGEAPLPGTLEEVLAARIDALPPEARALVRWCGLLDGEITVDLLESLAGVEARRAMERLLLDGVLVTARGPRESLAFAHPALSRVARASVDPTQLAGMHARIAAALERTPGSRGMGAAAVARHRVAAGAIRPAARAWLESALARRAAGQNREALEAFAHVLKLTDDAPDPEGHALRFATHLGREDIARLAGLTRARRTELLAMRAIAAQTRDPRLVARALSRQARYKLETALGTGIERDVAAAVRSARRANEPRTEAEARRVLASYLGQRGRYAEALAASEASLRALDSRGALVPPLGGSTDDGVSAARSARVEALLVRGALLRQTGSSQAALEVYAEAWALIVRHGPRRLLAAALVHLATACLSQNAARDALRLALAAVATQREMGQRDRLAIALSKAGQAAVSLGQHDRAFAFLKRSVDLYARFGMRTASSAEAHTALAELYVVRGEIELALGEVERARGDAEMAASRYERVGVWLAEARVAIARRAYDEALASATEGERLASSAGIVGRAVHARAVLAEVHALRGEWDRARTYVENILADPAFAEPLTFDQGGRVLSACEGVLRSTGDPARAEALAELRRRDRPSNPGTEPNGAGAGAGT